MSQVKKVIISPLIAVSTTTQTELMKKLLKSKGYEVEFKSTVSVFDIRDDKNVAFIWFNLCTIKYIGDAVWPYIYCKKPKAVYVTIEGIPTKANILCSNLPKLDFICNSHFTADCLKQVKLNVIDVVHHAIDYKNCQVQRKASKELRGKWEGEFGDKTKILYVGRNDPRKGLDHFAKALGYLDKETMRQCVFLLFSDGDLTKLTKYPNVLSIGTSGGLPHDRVLQMMGACDYLIFPTVSEGFGLPVLEANACGVPVIHSWIPPLDEFSSKEFNFVFPFEHETLVNNANVQYWRFHQYRPSLLTEMIIHAVQIHQDKKGEYEEYCQKALEHTKAWDYKKIYPKLMSHIGIK